MHRVIILFLSLVLAGYAQAFRFVVYSDNQGIDDVFLRLVQKVNQEPDIAFAVCCGDSIPNGKESEYKHYLNSIKALKTRLYQAMGNHDGVKYGYKYFTQYIGPYYFSFDYDNSHFIVLNNAFNSSFDKAQTDWLTTDLEKNKQTHTFVFMHRPVIDPTDGAFEHHIMSNRAATEYLMKMFSRYKVDYVFTGHVHGYAKNQRDGVNYVITAGAGAPLYLPREFGGFYHYVVMTVDGDNIKEEVKKLYE